MGCCGGGYNPNGNDGNSSNHCHGGRGFNICHIVLVGGIVLLLLKAVL